MIKPNIDANLIINYLKTYDEIAEINSLRADVTFLNQP